MAKLPAIIRNGVVYTATSNNASNVGFVNTGTTLTTSGTVQDAIVNLDNRVTNLPASAISYSNTNSGIAVTTTQTAIDAALVPVSFASSVVANTTLFTVNTFVAKKVGNVCFLSGYFTTVTTGVGSAMLALTLPTGYYPLEKQYFPLSTYGVLGTAGIEGYVTTGGLVYLSINGTISTSVGLRFNFHYFLK